MKIEYTGNNTYRGVLNRHNGASILYGADRWFIISMLIQLAYTSGNTQPHFREDEEAWTDDDWERDFKEREEDADHKDDDKI